MIDNRCAVLLDIGGTFIKSTIGIVGGEIDEMNFACVPVNSEGSYDSIAASLRGIVGMQTRRALEMGLVVSAVSVAVPGPFDYENGIFQMKHK